jgi:predicted GH43/DUF377 family glycosyl hydrolase
VGVTAEESGTYTDFCLINLGGVKKDGSDGDVFRMYYVGTDLTNEDGDKLNLRPIAACYAESRDGIHWSRPQIVLEPNSNTNWEGDINRPTVIELQDGYHMWYTGQARDHSWIGYATSLDGVHWTRCSTEPVLSPENRGKRSP